MSPQNTDRILFVRKRRPMQADRDSAVVRISGEVYNSVADIATETRMSLSEIVTALVHYALPRVELIDAE